MIYVTQSKSFNVPFLMKVEELFISFLYSLIAFWNQLFDMITLEMVFHVSDDHGGEPGCLLYGHLFRIRDHAGYETSIVQFYEPWFDLDNLVNMIHDHVLPFQILLNCTESYKLRPVAWPICKKHAIEIRRTFCLIRYRLTHLS